MIPLPRVWCGDKTLPPQGIFGSPDLKQYGPLERIMTAPRRPAFASQDWMLEQQLRAEMEAEAWRRLRELSTAPELPADVTVSTVHDEPDYHRSGSIILKALVRFALAACGGYLAWIAALDARLGEFEIWLSVGGAFVVTLALSLIGPARGFVHLLAETMRWGLIICAALGALWLLVQGQA
jgi:hypothetical protein